MVSDIGIGDVVRHFKGRYYRILGFGEHTETGEKEVIYQALYPPFGTWVRPYDMFMGEVDHEKYPDVKQKYRFEVMTITDLCLLAAEENHSLYFKNQINTLINSAQPHADIG